MKGQLPIPESLRPRIKGVEKLLEIMGPEYDFHDSEVEVINIKKHGEVSIRIWSSWATKRKGEFITEWNLHDCVGLDTFGYDPNVYWLDEMWLEEEDQWIKMILAGVGLEFTCKSIDVTIRPYDEKNSRLYFDMDNVLVDFTSGIRKLDEKTRAEYEGRLDEVPGIFSLMEPMRGQLMQ